MWFLGDRTSLQWKWWGILTSVVASVPLEGTFSSCFGTGKENMPHHGLYMTRTRSNVANSR